MNAAIFGSKVWIIREVYSGKWSVLMPECLVEVSLAVGLNTVYINFLQIQEGDRQPTLASQRAKAAMILQ